MSDPLDALWLLCEEELTTKQRMAAAVDKAKDGGTDLGGGQVKGAGRAGLEIGRKPAGQGGKARPKPNPSPGIDDASNSTIGTTNTTPQAGPENKALQQRQLSDKALQSGVGPGEAIGMAGVTDMSTTTSRAFGAKVFAADQEDNGANIRFRDDSSSLAAIEAKKNANAEAPSPMDAKTANRNELDNDAEAAANVPDDIKPSGGDAGDATTAGGEVARLASQPQDAAKQLTPEQELDDDISNIQTTLGTQEDTPESIEYKSQQTQPEITPRQQSREDERKQTLIDTLNRIMETPEKKKGAGANKLSREDAELLRKYIQGEGPKLERMDITDEDMAFAKDYLKKNFKRAFTKLSLGTKGAPKELYEGRGDAVLKSYLANKGLSAVTGEPLAYSASELDHITSLGNGGVDGFDNWAWVDKRYNQFMSAHDDEGVLAKVDKLLSQSPDDERLKELKAELSNETRSRYSSYFKKKGYANVTEEDIKGAKGEAGNQMLKALAGAAGVSTYKGSEDRTRARGRFIGYPALKAALIEKIKPITQDQQEEFDEALMEIKQFIEDKNAEMEPFTKRGRKKRSMKEAYLEWLLETKFGYTLIQEDVEEEYEEEELDNNDDNDYNEDIAFLQKYGRA